MSRTTVRNFGRIMLLAGVAAAMTLNPAPLFAQPDPSDPSVDLVPERIESRPENAESGQSRRQAIAAEADLNAALGLDSSMSVSINADPAAVQVSGVAIGGMPSADSEYVVLSTGIAADVVGGGAGQASTSLGGAPRGVTGNDLTQITIEATPPPGARCVALDAVFLSEEYPQYVGSQFNDAFTVEVGESNISVSGGTNLITAPNNVAQDTDGNIVSVNTVFGLGPIAGTPFNGGTALLTAAAPIPGNQQGPVRLIVSIQDIGDNILDSAVLLDNVRYLFNPGCSSGAIALTDSDGDGLPDEWEINGIDGIDLPAMGADPYRKDLFVDAYWMERPATNGFLFWKGKPAVSFRPKDGALEQARIAFANAPTTDPYPNDGREIKAGIHLHVDNGSLSTMNHYTGEKWGSLSTISKQVEHIAKLGEGSGSDSDKLTRMWNDFERITKRNENPARQRIFRAALFADEYFFGGSGFAGVGNAAPEGFSNETGAYDRLGTRFVLTGGNFNKRSGFSTQQMAGTFIHELGHTLGLGHGGTDHEGYKPNYFSVMNYAHQLAGLPTANSDRKFDYSRAAAGTLDENNLSEVVGVTNAEGMTEAKYTCGVTPKTVPIPGPIDWNCDGDWTNGVRSDVNRGDQGSDYTEKFTELVGAEDWSKIKLDADGFIGGRGAEYVEPLGELEEDLTEEAAINLDILGQVGTGHASVAGPGTLFVDTEGQRLQVDVYNFSTAPHSFTVDLRIDSTQEVLSQTVDMPGRPADSLGVQRIEFEIPVRPLSGVETFDLTIKGVADSTSSTTVDYINRADLDVPGLLEFLDTDPSVDPGVRESVKDALGSTPPVEPPLPGTGSSFGPGTGSAGR